MPGLKLQQPGVIIFSRHERKQNAWHDAEVMWGFLKKTFLFNDDQRAEQFLSIWIK